MSTVIHRQHNGELTMIVRDQLTATQQAFLRHVVWGENGPRFQIANVEQRFKSLEDPLFISLEKSGGLIGSYCLSQRKVYVGGNELAAIYRTGFAIDPACRGLGYGEQLAQFAKEYFTGHLEQAKFSYGFVDSQSTRSLSALSKAGYECAGSFKPIVFSRFRPQEKVEIQELGFERQAEWNELLRVTYESHALVSLTARGKRYCLLENDEIVAGVQVNSVPIQLDSLRGLWGRVFGLKHYHVLTFEAVYWRSGYEEDFIDFLESLLKMYGAHFALFFVDTRSALFEGLKTLGGLGLVDRFYRTEPIHVMIAAQEACQPKLMTSLKNAPFYIAASDVI